MAKKIVKPEEPLDVTAHNQATIDAEAQANANLAKVAADKEAAAAAAVQSEADKQAKLAKASRQARWDALVENFKKEKPLAYEARKHTGEFDNIPESFE